MEVTMAGKKFRVRSDADEHYVQTLARFVDKKLEDISRQTHMVTTGHVALLAALDIADELFRALDRSREFRDQVSGRSSHMLDLLEAQARPSTRQDDSPGTTG